MLSCLLVANSQAVEVINADTQYRITRWKTDDGLPQNRIQCILQTSDGYLWFGTRFGLGRFDGVRFAVFDSANTPELVNQSCIALAEDREGALWIGTEAGLLRRKRGRFTRFTVADGLPDDAVKQLWASGSGGVWVGTRSGLGRYRGGKFSWFSVADGLKENLIRSICEMGQGVLVVATSGGLQVFDGGRFKDLSPPLALPLMGEVTLQADRAGLWLGTDAGLHRLVDGGWTSFNQLLLNPALRQEIPIQVASEASPRRERTLVTNLPVRLVGAGQNDWANGIWVVTENVGVNHFQEGRFTPVDFSLGQIGVSCGYEDREGNLWLGTVGDGLLRLQPRRVRSYSVRDGLGSDDVVSVCEGHDGCIWVGTGRGLGRICDSLDSATSNVQSPKFKVQSPTWDIGHRTLGFERINSVLVDSGDRLWLGVAGKRLFQFKDGQLRDFTAAAQPLLNSGVSTDLTKSGETGVQALYEDRGGSVWIGSDRGVTRYKEGQFTHYVLGLPHAGVSAIVEDRAGDFWFGNRLGGLCRFAQPLLNPVRANTNTAALPVNRDQQGLGKFTVFGIKDGLGNNRVRSLHVDGAGVVWVGTEAGLYRFLGERFFGYTQREGLLDDVVNQVLEDGLGNMWLGGNRGVYRVSRQELDDVAAGKAASVNCAAYGEADGLLSGGTSGEGQPAGWQGRDGRLWFATAKGLVVIDPKQIRENEVLPPTVIEQVLVDGEVVFDDGVRQKADIQSLRSKGRSPVSNVQNPKSEVSREETKETKTPISNPQSETIELPPGRGRVVEIRYTANSFVAPERVRFKYRLEKTGGSSPKSKAERATLDVGNWTSDTDNRRMAFLTDLKPGGYRFHVVACNNHGLWNTTGAEFSFYMAPSFYQTWTFYISCGMAVFGLGFSLHVIRVAFLNKFQQLEQEHALEEERARIAQDMHDDLGANLTKIAILSETAKKSLSEPRLAASQLERISSTASEVLDNLGEIIWAMNHENDTLDNLCAYLREYAAQSFELTSVNGYIDFPAQVPEHPISAEFRRHIFLVIKEGLHNIVKHSGAADANLMLTLPDGRLEILIADNGRGFALDQVSQFGNGLTGMRQRVSQMNGTFDLQSQPGRGTQIKISIKL